MAVVASFDEDKQERLTLWRSGDTAHVARADEPGSAVVSTADYEAAVRALDDVLK